MGVRPEVTGNENEDEFIKMAITILKHSTARKDIAAGTANGLYVSADSDPGKVAGAIANYVRDDLGVFCSAVGPYAILRAVQSITLARRYLANTVVALYFAPQFEQDHR